MNITNLKPFGRFCVTLGMIPSSYKESLTYEEQLLWFCNYLETEVIPKVNENADAVNELIELYNQLQEYVQNYFDNLDIQTEIDNKLDEMAESGELTDIIAQYLQLAGVLAYNTISDLASAENIVEGSICYVLGQTTYNDGKGGFYKVRTLTSGDIIDGFNIVALEAGDTIIAERMPNYYINQINDNLTTINQNINTINQKITNMETLYSTDEEIIIGYLKRNNQLIPIYQKTFLTNFTQSHSAGTPWFEVVPSVLSEVDILIDCHGSYDNRFPIGFDRSDNYITAYLEQNGYTLTGDVQVNTDEEYILTFQYTKNVI